METEEVLKKLRAVEEHIVQEKFNEAYEIWSDLKSAIEEPRTKAILSEIKDINSLPQDIQNRHGARVLKALAYLYSALESKKDSARCHERAMNAYLKIEKYNEWNRAIKEGIFSACKYSDLRQYEDAKRVYKTLIAAAEKLKYWRTFRNMQRRLEELNGTTSKKAMLLESIKTVYDFEKIINNKNWRLLYQALLKHKICSEFVATQLTEMLENGETTTERVMEVIRKNFKPKA